MKEKVVSLLDRYGYKVGYSSFHSDSEIKKLIKEEPGVQMSPTFTLYSPDSYVIRRIPNLGKDDEMQSSHVEMICDAFSMYELPHRQDIISSLRNVLKEKSL